MHRLRFWLGVHEPAWLGRTNAPLFVSAVRLRRLRRALPRAVGAWALDSGAFSEITTHGRWTIPATQYASEARGWRDRIGGMEWCAIQDWMCEPFMLQKTGLSVGEHQRRTVHSYLLLRVLAPDLPWVPVLQGWVEADYHRHADAYLREGIDLPSLPVVGLGSVCRRQATREVRRIARSLRGRGLRNLHGFGVKTAGLAAGLTKYLASSDSMAWSTRGRQQWQHEGSRCCSVSHDGGCANCLHWAIAWRRRVVSDSRARSARGSSTLNT